MTPRQQATFDAMTRSDLQAEILRMRLCVRLGRRAIRTLADLCEGLEPDQGIHHPGRNVWLDDPTVRAFERAARAPRTTCAPRGRR